MTTKMAEKTFKVSGEKSGKGGGGSGGLASEDTLRSKATARVIDLISEGEIEGIVGGGEGIFLGGIPLKNPDGTFNFEGFQTFSRTGTPNQAHIEGFPAVEAEVDIGTEVRNGTPLTLTINDGNIDAIRLKIRVDQLGYYDEDDGEFEEINLQFRVAIKTASGSFVNQVLSPNAEDKSLGSIYGKTSSPYERAYRMELPKGGHPWQVRITKVSQNFDDDDNMSVDMFVDSYTQIIDAKLSYPDCAIVAMTADAEKFGNTIPERLFHVKGLKTKVPTNYDPIAGTYSGLWNGSFKTVWHNNPAWVLYALMTDKRFGLGDIIPESSVDKFGLDRIGRYCDELVPSGRKDGGGNDIMERRYTYNGVIRTRQEAARALDTLAAIFRGMIYWGAGAIIVTQDSPETATQLVTNANVINGDFTYVGSALSARSSSVAVTWNDPTDYGKPSVEVVQRDDLIRKFGDRRKEVTLAGCNRRSQAHRTADWILYTEEHETEMVTYQASLDHHAVRPGKIIKIADQHLAAARLGGRLASVNTGTFTVALDSPFTYNTGETHNLSIVFPDGQVRSYAITNQAGVSPIATAVIASADRTRFTTDVNAAGAGNMVNMIWVITGTDVAPREWRVVTVVEKADNIFEVQALLHKAGKYAYVERGIPLDETPYTTIPTGMIVPPTNLVLTKFLRAKPGAQSTQYINASWKAAVGDARVIGYNIRIKSPLGSWDFVAQTGKVTYDIEIKTNDTGTYSVEVRSVTGLGQESAGLVATTALAQDDKSTAPAVPTGWIGLPGIDGIALDGDDHPASDFKTFRIYAGNSSNGSFTKIAETPNSYWSRITLPTGLDNYYRITAVNHSGKESAPFPGPTSAIYVKKSAITVEDLDPNMTDPFDTTPPPTLVAPTLTTFVDPISGRISIKADWPDSIAVDFNNYDVRIRAVGGTYISSFTTTSEYTWTNVVAGTTYEVSVRAFDWNNNPSVWSPTASIVAAKDNVAPATPTGLVAQSGFGTIFLSWNENSEPDMAGYDIYESASSTTPVVGTTPTVRVTATNWTRTGLGEGVTRYYWIRAFDTSGNRSAWFPVSPTTVSATTVTFNSIPGTPGTPAAPGVTSSIRTTGASGTEAVVVVTWTTTANSVQYEVGITQGGNEVVVAAGTPNTGTTARYEFTTQPGIAYSIRVRGVSAVGVKSVFGPATAHTAAADTVPAAVPVGLALSPGFQTLYIQWTPNTETDLKHYELYVAGNATPPAEAAAATYTTTANILVVTGYPSTPTAQWVYIRSRDTSGNKSVWSSVQTTTTLGLISTDITGIVDANAFALGIKTIEVLGALPVIANTNDAAETAMIGRQVFLTLDGKLYRYTGDHTTYPATASPTKPAGWTRSTDGADIIANSITAGQIAAAAINTAQLAAGAITVEKLAVTAADNLVPLGRFDATMTGSAGAQPTFVLSGGASGSYTFSTTTASGNRSLQIAKTVTTQSIDVTVPAFGRAPVQGGQVYWIEVAASAAAAIAAGFTARPVWYDVAGAELAADTSAGFENLALTTSFQTFNAKVTAPATARYVGWRLTNGSTNATTNAILVDRVVIRKADAAQLIVDGSLTANMVGANQIIANSANIADAIITSAKIASLEAGKITSGSVLSGSIVVDGRSLGSAVGTAPTLYDTIMQDWAKVAGAGSFTYVTGVSTESGTRALTAVGNTVWAESPNKMPFDPTKLYRIKFRVRRNGASGTTPGTMYLGLLCFASNPVYNAQGVQTAPAVRLSATGADAVSSGHYVVANAVSQSGVPTGFTDYVGYVKGTSGTIAQGAGTIAAPKPLYTGTKYIAPLVIFNNTVADGTGTAMVLDSVMIETVVEESAELVNAGTTTILPGRISINAADTATLTSLIGGPNSTEILGGKILTGSIRTNSIEVGARNITLDGVVFSYGLGVDGSGVHTYTNKLEWTGGTLKYYDDTNTLVSVTISQMLAGAAATWTTGTQYVYFDRVNTPGTLKIETNPALIDPANHVILASYQGTNKLNANWGKTIIDGSVIKTGTIVASNLIQTQAVIAVTAQIANAIITDAKIVSLTANKVKAGVVETGSVTISSQHYIDAMASLGSVDKMDIDWSHSLSGTATVIYPATSGTTGALGTRIMRASTGGGARVESPQRVPFDPTKTYRVTMRIRRNGTAGATPGNVFLGVQQYDDSQAEISNTGTAGNTGNYCILNGLSQASVSTAWVEYVGFIKGVTASSGAGAENAAAGAGALVTNPATLFNTTRYIGLVAIFNNGLVSGGTTMEMDFAKIEIDAASEISSLGPYTQIDPGAIRIQGTTSLSDWRQGSDLTKIAGGAISANTIDANKVTIGVRGVAIDEIEFEHNKGGTSRLQWTGGKITYVNDAGGDAQVTIVDSETHYSGGVLWVSGTLYVYWIKGETRLRASALRTDAVQDDRIILATYAGTTKLVSTYGRTVIDGSSIKTGTITASNLITSAALITTNAQIGTAVVKAINIKGFAITYRNIFRFNTNLNGTPNWKPTSTSTFITLAEMKFVRTSGYRTKFVVSFWCSASGSWDSSKANQAAAELQLTRRKPDLNEVKVGYATVKSGEHGFNLPVTLVFFDDDTGNNGGDNTRYLLQARKFPGHAENMNPIIDTITIEVEQYKIG